MTKSPAGDSRTPQSDLCLRADEVSVHYRSGGRQVIALDALSLQAPAGCFGLLSGASGSGKSTLLGVFGALIRPTSGCVYIGAQDITRASSSEMTRQRRRIGFVFQNFALLERLSAWENVAIPLIARGESHRERKSRAESLLADLGLGHRIHANVAELSGGEQQRIAFARALAASPEILLADEPTANLDDAAASHFVQQLLERHRQGLTTLVASHDERFREVATHTWRLKGGRLTDEAAL